MKTVHRILLTLALLSAGMATAASSPDTAKQILNDAGIRGGLIVHLGCGDGKLTAALRVNNSFIVHGLDADVTAARQYIQSLGLYGPVSVERWTTDRLPYADNLVNLVIAENPDRISTDEIMRVLVPDGVAIIGGKKSVKSRSKEIDEWTHFLHDAGNNAVANDSRIGAPRSLQWMAPPLWLRSHETPSGFEAMVCGGGRTFYILDEGLIGITDQRLPERWALLCRDAFNGKLLWRKPLGAWGWPLWAADKFANADWTTITGGRTVVPDENQRRVVVDGDRLFVTMSYLAPLTILDAATGQTLATVAETAPAREIVAADGITVVHSQTGVTQGQKRKGKAAVANGTPSALIAVKGATGAVLWRKEVTALHELSLAINSSRVIYQSGTTLVALDLHTGKQLWNAESPVKTVQTLVACDNMIVVRSANALAALNAANGRLLWQKQISAGMGLGAQDLFVINGIVWPGVVAANESKEPEHKGASALATGYDLRTGAERKRVFAVNILSPEHHHRCYRNKATDRYVITSMEGAEFIDLQGTDNSQNNFVRGACKVGMMPCNGMLYVPPDQCFCQPGAKLLGFTAIGSDKPGVPVPDAQRLERGPVYSEISAIKSQNSDSDWPTYRHDAARHGTTPAVVGAAVHESWHVKLGGNLTAPVAAGDLVFVAASDAHTVHALDLRDGKPAWNFMAGGRIDSPPTVVNGLVLFGSADGWVYCLRAVDGALAWRFLAAPSERRIVCFDQVESTWPVHGSVLVRDGVAYVTAGRSTYLDGGITVYALEPSTGCVLHQTTLAGPFPDAGKTIPRDVSFYINGANSDVLVSEGDAIYMRQKQLTPALKEVQAEVLSSKGESDVGLHIFSTAGLLDSSWYNRTFWMYAKRWPGFQLANQAPKSGQLLVVDEANTFAVQPYYRRNVHTPMFFPGKEGYLLYADKNNNEPQIVGEQGARKPVAWLPQSDYLAGKGPQTLDSEAFGLDKMIGYTRAEPPLWQTFLPVRIRAMVKAGDTLFVAGPPDEFDTKDPYATFEGRKGAQLVTVLAKDGKKLTECALEAPPVFDGLIAASGRLLVALEDGSLVCLGGKP